MSANSMKPRLTFVFVTGIAAEQEIVEIQAIFA